MNNDSETVLLGKVAETQLVRPSGEVVAYVKYDTGAMPQFYPVIAGRVHGLTDHDDIAKMQALSYAPQDEKAEQVPPDSPSAADDAGGLLPNPHLSLSHLQQQLRQPEAAADTLPGEVPQGFTDYVKANYRGVVDFYSAEWHAKRLWRAAMRHSPTAVVMAVDRADFEEKMIAQGFDVSRDAYGEYHQQGVMQRWQGYVMASRPPAMGAGHLAPVAIGWITTGDVEYTSEGAEIGDWDINWDHKVIDILPEFSQPETTYGVYLNLVADRATASGEAGDQKGGA